MSSTNENQNPTTPSASTSCAGTRAYDIDAGTIRRVDWQELVPVTLFFRAFSATFKSSYLILVSLLFTAAFMFDWLPADFLRPHREGESVSLLAESVDSENPDAYSGAHIAASCLEGASVTPRPYRNLLDHAFHYPGLFIASSFESSEKGGFVGFFKRSWSGFVFGLVWLFTALAISRTAVVRLASTSRSSTIASLLFARRRFLSAFAPFAAVVFLIGCVWLCRGLAANSGVVGAALAPVVALVLLGLQALIAVLVFASPMCVAAVAAENCDGFDAISHGVSYLLQRPLFLILYVGLAIVFTFVGACCVAGVALPAYSLYSSALYSEGFYSAAPPSRFVGFFGAFLLNLPLAYAYVASVVYAGAIYILLRRSVDGTPFDSCALNLTNRAPKQLRKILKDAKGAPTFDAQQTVESKESGS